MKRFFLGLFRLIHGRIKLFAVGVLLHRILIPLMLCCTYFFAIGMTSLFARLFARPHLRPISPDAQSTWVRAEGYDITFANGSRQS